MRPARDVALPLTPADSRGIPPGLVSSRIRVIIGTSGRGIGPCLAEHELVEAVGGGLVHARDDVLVGVGGEGVGMVAEPFLDDLDVDAE